MQTIVRRPNAATHGKLSLDMGKLKPEKAFGMVLRELREQRALSQEGLALASGLDRTFISLLERGLRQPSLTSILKLSESLDISPAALVEKVVERMKRG